MGLKTTRIVKCWQYSHAKDERIVYSLTLGQLSKYKHVAALSGHSGIVMNSLYIESIPKVDGKCLTPSCSHVIGQLGMVMLKFIGSFGVAHNDGVDSTADNAQQRRCKEITNHKSNAGLINERNIN